MIEPVVTIVVATSDRVKPLTRALLSVLGQTYDPWVCHVVGDACRDGTAEFMAEVLDAYPDRFRWTNLPTKTGPLWLHTGAMPKTIGVQEAETELIAFLDDDNEYLPRHLEDLVSFFRSKEGVPGPEYGLVWSDMEYLAAESGRRIRQHRPKLPLQIGSIDSSEILVRADLAKIAGGWITNFPHPQYPQLRIDDYCFAEAIVNLGRGFRAAHLPKVSVRYWDRRLRDPGQPRAPFPSWDNFLAPSRRYMER